MFVNAAGDTAASDTEKFPARKRIACSRGSASEEELPAARAKKSLQAARARSKKQETRNKKQEARNKKPGSNKKNKKTKKTKKKKIRPSLLVEFRK